MWIYRASDEVEAKGRAASERAKLKAGIVITVGLELGTMGVDEHDLPAHPARQRPRLLVHRIAEILDSTANPLAGFRANVCAIVQNTRDRDTRDASGPGDIIDRRILPRHARNLATVSTLRNG